MKSEEGYTLLETVVAMALFVSVLIPLVVTIGRLFLDGGADNLRSALRLAETEMSLTAANRDYSDLIKDENGLQVERKILRRVYLVRVQIMIAPLKNPTQELVVVSKFFLDYE